MKISRPNDDEAFAIAQSLLAAWFQGKPTHTHKRTNAHTTE